MAPKTCVGFWYRIWFSAKIFDMWLPLIVYSGWRFGLIRVTAAWMHLWSNAILIWYHYIVNCTLVTISNWLSCKGMKLWVLIKDAFVFYFMYIYFHLFFRKAKYNMHWRKVSEVENLGTTGGLPLQLQDWLRKVSKLRQ